MSRYLCEDLIGEIFERLPVESLVRFRCLSKSWYIHIGSTYFKRRHYLRSKQIVLIRRWETSLRDVKVRMLDSHGRDEVKDLYALHSDDCFPLCHGPGYFDTPTIEFPCHLSKVVNSCNGILCLFDYHENRISLWNPSIRRKVTLPNHPSFKDYHDGEKLSVVVGFGFDPITDDYKIVRISYVKFEKVVVDSFVYSLKTRAWSAIASPPTPFELVKYQACFVNGQLHWVVQLIPDRFYNYILTFNLNSHVFGKIMLPQSGCFTTKPTVIDGCLSVVCYGRDNYCSIWVLKEYNNVASWYVHFKKKCISEDEVKRVIQLSTKSCYFLINNQGYGLQVYNQVTGVRFSLFETRSNKVYMDACHESLELLDCRELES